MANLEVTSSVDYVEVSFNAFAASAGTTKAIFRRSAISQIRLCSGDIQITLDNNSIWRVSLDGANDTLIIDTVEAMTPTNLSDLYDKLKVFMRL